MELRQVEYLLLEKLKPSIASNRRRKEILNFVTNLIKSSLGENAIVALSGSSAINCYLPEGDLDVVVCTKSISESGDVMLQLVSSICSTIALSDNISNTAKPFIIRNIEFINARTKLLSLKVNNINVDVTVNQCGAISTAIFLEEVDKIIGYNHLFKRSLILVKAWCVRESTTYCGKSILSPKDGLLTSYALAVMVIFVLVDPNIEVGRLCPIDVLRLFLNHFAIFPWDTHVVTIGGAIPISAINDRISNHVLHPVIPESAILKNILEVSRTLNSRLSKQDRAMSTLGSSSSFPMRCCNIMDPIDVWNNIGYSVSRPGLVSIQRALNGGTQHVEYLVGQIQAVHPSMKEMYINMMAGQKMVEPGMYHVASVEFDSKVAADPDFGLFLLHNLFPNCNKYYFDADYVRADLRDHPLQVSTQMLYTSDSVGLSKLENEDVFSHDVSGLWKSLDSVSALWSTTSTLSLTGKSSTENANVGQISCETSNSSILKHENNVNEKYSVKRTEIETTRPIVNTAVELPKNAVQDVVSDAVNLSNLSSSSDVKYSNKSRQTAKRTKKLKEESELNATSVIDDQTIAVAPLVSQSAQQSNEIVNEIETQELDKKSDRKKKKKSSEGEGRDVGPVGKNSASSDNNHDDKVSMMVLTPSIVSSRGSTVVMDKHVSSSIFSFLWQKILAHGTAFVLFGLCSFVYVVIFHFHVDLAQFLSASGTLVTSIQLPLKLATVFSPRHEPRTLSGTESSVFGWIKLGESASFGVMDRKNWVRVSVADHTTVERGFPSNVTHWENLIVMDEYDGTTNSTDEKSCCVDGYVYQWYYNGSMLSSLQLQSNRENLVLPTAVRQSSGTYSCLVTCGKELYFAGSTRIKISAPPFAKNKPQYLELAKNTTLLLNLNVEGEPYPAIQWYRNGYALPGQVNSTLLIAHVTKVDIGTYTCILKNLAGTFEWLEASVMVKD